MSKRECPRTEPCGTPCSNGTCLSEASTAMDRPVRNETKTGQGFFTNTMMQQLTKKDLVCKTVESFLHIKEYCKNDKS